MKKSSKILIVVAGYLAALLIAAGVVYAYVLTTSGPDRQASAGMFAFGDAILFLLVFGLAAIPATSAALFFLRLVAAFWRNVSVLSLGIAATAIAALINYVFSSPGALSGLSPLRVFLSPLLSLGFFLAFVFAPNRFARFTLLGSSFIEAVVFGWAAWTWFHPLSHM